MYKFAEAATIFVSLVATAMSSVDADDVVFAARKCLVATTSEVSPPVLGAFLPGVNGQVNRRYLSDGNRVDVEKTPAAKPTVKIIDVADKYATVEVAIVWNDRLYVNRTRIPLIGVNAEMIDNTATWELSDG